MRSPADMEIIQVDVTNACTKRCSNCTRFCGNHEQSYFMDYTTFKRAIDSLEGFDGLIGIMGGEPTVHPEFERFLRYIQEKFGLRTRENRQIFPQNQFMKEMRKDEYECRHVVENSSGKRIYKKHGVGLFSNMGPTYSNYYEICNDTFDVQFLNDHINPSYHQPGLFSRKDLGIPDDEWIKMRDKCWVQNEWSATITPKGCFFCEIAGALDMLFDGPGGWPIEPGWWKRTPEEFGNQLHWCEICGFALDTFMRDAEDEIDDVSPTLYEMLEKVNSPRFKQGKTNLVKINDGVIAEESKATGKHFTASQPYIEHYEDRFNESNSQLFIHEYEAAVVADGDEFGKQVNSTIKKAKEWVLLCEREEILGEAKQQIEELISKCILNPGTLHKGERFIFFSKKALSLRAIGFDRVAMMKQMVELVDAWDVSKVVRLNLENEYVSWKHDSIIPGARYAIWGAGFSSEYISDVIRDSEGELVFLIDKDSCKQGLKLFGVEVLPPEYLMSHTEEYDYMIIANYSRFDEIFGQAIELGVPKEKIIMPYEL